MYHFLFCPGELYSKNLSGTKDVYTRGMTGGDLHENTSLSRSIDVLSFFLCGTDIRKRGFFFF
jgi:hypothetical protein